MNGEANRAGREIGPPFDPNIPYGDYYPVIRKKAWELWANEWTQVRDNKLRCIKPAVQPWKSANNRKSANIVYLVISFSWSRHIPRIAMIV